jgi:5-hydroxyisourate hydrolase
MSTLSTHVLDTSLGRPGAGIAVRLDRVSEPAGPVATGVTDGDGRVAQLGTEDLPAGTYQLTFETGAYLEQSGAPVFFPSVTVTLSTAATEPHYHVPLLLSPFAYSTYRGS